MEKLDIIDIVDAKTIGESEFPKEFLVEKICDQAIFDCVIAEHNSTRQGTHSTLTKAEVRGGGIKPRPQKHSGRARQGSIRNPQ
jgi:large subunit ribosomal protein L4